MDQLERRKIDTGQLPCAQLLRVILLECMLCHHYPALRSRSLGLWYTCSVRQSYEHSWLSVEIHFQILRFLRFFPRPIVVISAILLLYGKIFCGSKLRSFYICGMWGTINFLKVRWQRFSHTHKRAKLRFVREEKIEKEKEREWWAKPSARREKK